MKLKKLVSKPVNVFLRCNDVKRQDGSLLSTQTSRKDNFWLISFSIVNLMLGCCELRKSKNDKASCSVLKRQKVTTLS